MTEAARMVPFMPDEQDEARATVWLIIILLMILAVVIRVTG